MNIKHLLIASLAIVTLNLSSLAQSYLPDRIIPFTYDLVVQYKKGLYGLKEAGAEGKEMLPAKYHSYTIHDFNTSLGISVIEFNGTKLATKYFTSGRKEITDSIYKELVHAHNFKEQIAGTVSTRNSSPDTDTSNSSASDSVAENATFAKVQTDPWFRSGQKDAATYINEEINNAKKNSPVKDKGVVTISFVVEKDGSISAPSVTKSSSDELSKLSLGILQKMPVWQPAVQGGRAVRALHKLSFEW
ncbi:energy transducer TonB [Terrimonas sp. NA20]|uniref:Energy transducer TonB n=1 Tax=Terrimonas ginsenosidimutans TaxID=2908004 RepID=A0ABS9KSH1_9BACT|nr:energy transducer TonB [Terrimonas ginsenosidimutans]MCG2615276.1 energy transducer TonB [Terrimonas ginsenosidimutans]